MSELIDREALKDAVKRYAGEPIKKKDRKCQAICLDMLGTIDAQPAASPWHRVVEPPKGHGPFLCASKSERNGQTHWFFELCWYADGDLKDVVFDAEQDSGFYSWSASQDRDIDSRVDYWMQIEPPKEEE